MDGLNTADANRRTGLVVVGATNRPQDIDSAVVRRLSRRILVDLPTSEQRKGVVLVTSVYFPKDIDADAGDSHHFPLSERRSE